MMRLSDKQYESVYEQLQDYTKKYVDNKYPCGKKYGLVEVLKQHQGIIIGMSAGSINMSTNAICTLSCGHNEQQIYRGLGCVNISVEPHFVRSKLSEEVLDLSKQYEIFGLCDESIIVCRGDTLEFYGEVYRIKDRSINNLKIYECYYQGGLIR